MGDHIAREAVFNRPIDVCWVIVTKKNGEQVRGLLGSESHLSVDPLDRDLFISQAVYEKEEGAYAIVPGSKGVYITASEISTIELIALEPEADHEAGI